MLTIKPGMEMTRLVIYTPGFSRSDFALRSAQTLLSRAVLNVLVAVLSDTTPRKLRTSIWIHAVEPLVKSSRKTKR
jgi:hypothetical protein